MAWHISSDCAIAKFCPDAGIIAFAEAEQMMTGVNSIVSETIDDGPIEDAEQFAAVN
jgi:hypothetical protein